MSMRVEYELQTINSRFAILRMSFHLASKMKSAKVQIRGQDKRPEASAAALSSRQQTAPQEK